MPFKNPRLFTAIKQLTHHVPSYLHQHPNIYSFFAKDSRFAPLKNHKLNLLSSLAVCSSSLCKLNLGILIISCMKIGKILLNKTSLSGEYSHSSKKKKMKKEVSEKKKIRKRSSRGSNKVQKLYDTCKEVFANGMAGYVPPPDDIQRLRSVLDSLEPRDIKLTAPSLEFSSRNGTDEAPLGTYIKLHECNKFSIGIFCLPPSGVIPLHNHPGMTVFSKLLVGTMHAKSYDWVQNQDHQLNHRQQQSGIRLAKVHVDSDLTAPCNASVLFPESGGNMHCFKAVTPCILLDVLGPPYSEAEGRHCTHYQDYPYDRFSDVKEVELEDDVTRYAWLEERNEQFVVLPGTYDGPTIKL